MDMVLEMKKVRKIVQAILATRNLSSQKYRMLHNTKKSVMPASPRANCSGCGGALTFFWLAIPVLLKIKNMPEPGWIAYECKVCAAESLKTLPVVSAQAMYKATSIKSRFLHESFESYILTESRPDQMQAYNTIKNYADNFKTMRALGKWLLFAGNSGTGKTHLAVSVAKEALKSGYTVKYVKTSRLIQKVKDNWANHSMRESEIIDSFVTVDLLILDEIGTQFGSKTEQDILYNVLDGRYEERKPLIATTNLPYEKFKAIVGPRISDRFLDVRTSNEVVIFNWESYRSGIKYGGY